MNRIQASNAGMPTHSSAMVWITEVESFFPKSPLIIAPNKGSPMIGASIPVELTTWAA